MNRTFRAFRVRNYRVFASGQAVSLVGTWMQRVGQDWLVSQLTNTSGSALGITLGLQFLPVLLFGLYGGVLADRYSKRRILLVTQSSMGVLAGILAALVISGQVTLWEVYLLAFLLGVATAVDNPTRQAFVMEMVGPDDVVNAVGLNSAMFNSARIVGPAIAGVLISVFGDRTGPLFLINALSYLAVLASLSVLREHELFRTAVVARARGQLREGLAYVRARPGLYLPIFLAGVLGTLGFNFQLTLVLMDRSVFHLGASAYGLLSSCLAFGSLIGALLAARRARPSLHLLVAGALAFGVFEILCGIMPTYDALALALVPAGITNMTFNTGANTTVQLGSESHMRGRVMGLYMLVFAGGKPIGAPLVGWIGGAFGGRASILVGGFASLAAALLVSAVLARSARAGRPVSAVPGGGRGAAVGANERSAEPLPSSGVGSGDEPRAGGPAGGLTASGGVAQPSATGLVARRRIPLSARPRR